MIAAGDVRIARQKNVIGINMLCEGIEERLHDKIAAAGMNRNAVRLTDQTTLMVGDETRKIVALIKNRTVSRARHALSHLHRNMVETILH
jgi:hypothetical protein